MAKIVTEVAHIIRDSDTTFKVKGQLAQGGGILWQPPAQLVRIAKPMCAPCICSQADAVLK